MSSALYSELRAPARAKPKGVPWSPPRRPPRTGPGPARSGWPGAAPRSRSGGPVPVGSAPSRRRAQTAIFRALAARPVHELGGGPPADDPPGVDVRHEGHVHPATHGAHVGDARHPQLVRPESDEMPVHQVGRAPPPRRGPGGAHRPGQRTTPCRPVPHMSRTGGAPLPRDRHRDARRSRADPARRASRGPRTPSSRPLWTRPIPLRRASSRALPAPGDRLRRAQAGARGDPGASAGRRPADPARAPRPAPPSSMNEPPPAALTPRPGETRPRPAQDLTGPHPTRRSPDGQLLDALRRRWRRAGHRRRSRPASPGCAGLRGGLPAPSTIRRTAPGPIRAGPRHPTPSQSPARATPTSTSPNPTAVPPRHHRPHQTRNDSQRGRPRETIPGCGTRARPRPGRFRPRMAAACASARSRRRPSGRSRSATTARRRSWRR